MTFGVEKFTFGVEGFTFGVEGLTLGVERLTVGVGGTECGRALSGETEWELGYLTAEATSLNYCLTYFRNYSKKVYQLVETCPFMLLSLSTFFNHFSSPS